MLSPYANPSPSSMPASLQFTMLWRQSDWGFYGRRNEVFARALAGRSDVANVLHVEFVALPELARYALKMVQASDPAMKRAYATQLWKSLPGYRPMRVSEHLNVASIGVILKRDARHPMIGRINRWLVAAQMSSIQAAQARFVHGTPAARAQHCVVAYVPSPYLTSALSVVDARVLVADLIDDVPSQVSDQDRRMMLQKSYEQVLPRCDWACATSPHVAETFQPYASFPIEVIRNGVHVLAPPTSPPEANTVGYVGMLNQTMNVDLMERVVSQLPQVTFKLAGPIHTDLRSALGRLHAAPNVEFPGPILKSDVPSFLQSCAALISFKRTGAVTAGNDSMKIYEYLAAGRPVVSTSVSPANRLRDVVHVADTAESFVSEIKEAVLNDSPERQKARLQVAQANSWSRRIDTFVERVRGCLPSAASSV